MCCHCFYPCYVLCIVTLQCLDHCHGIYCRVLSLFLSMLRSVHRHVLVLRHCQGCVFMQVHTWGDNVYLVGPAVVL